MSAAHSVFNRSAQDVCPLQQHTNTIKVRWRMIQLPRQWTPVATLSDVINAVFSSAMLVGFGIYILQRFSTAFNRW